MKRRSFLRGGGALGFWIAAARAESISGATVFSGDRIYAGDQELLLADIIAPSGYGLTGVAPYFREAKSKLHDLLLGATIDYEEVSAPTRWGGRVVHARQYGQEQTIQELLIAAGAARVAPQTAHHELIDRLLMLEQRARNQKTGLWGLDAYDIVSAENAARAIGAYHLIEGQVRKASKAGSRFYLNYGDDYRTDFTATARSALQRRWAADGLDLAGLEGRPVRVRGYVDNINGPSIDLVHIKQIEL